MNKVVGLGEWKSSNNKIDIITTFALSTCVAVTAYCPIKKAAGLVHIVLPEPLSNRDEQSRPGHFATTGVPLLIQMMVEKYGCRKNDLVIQLFGGAEPKRRDYYRIGSRNIKQVQSILDRLQIRAVKSETGGHVSRTLHMSVETGEVRLSTLPLSS
ncbi:CheD activator of MCP protein methylation [Paenibacillus taihuensis]|uniref:Probable chemoreceptor glutamine deamidase CheD n=1 Tax=Paenibacillus taihuensis TaxID=1156355 RepID=A0A3D9S239_9BACL|nr:chemotaxis protein CheD [Paenibacillus taihuensis]REE86514.1 CheD activator of MCP protein methylation [Paenibacillus taihuensis]